MSLRPQDRGGRARSGSTAGGGRERSHSNVRQPEAPRFSTYPPPPPRATSPMPGAFIDDDDDDDDGKPATYEVRAPSYASTDRTNHAAPPSSTASRYTPAPAKSAVPYPSDNGAYPNNYPPYPPQQPAPPGQHAGYYPPPPGPPPPRRSERDERSSSSSDEEDLAYGDDQHRVHEREPARRTQSYGNDVYRNPPIPAQDPRAQHSSGYDHVPPPEKVTYTTRPMVPSRPQSYTAAPQEPARPTAYPTAPQQPQRQPSYSSSTPSAQFHEQNPRGYSHNSFDRDAHVVDVTPGRERRDRTNSINTSSNRLSAYGEQPPSLQPGLAPRMNRLSVSGLQPDLHGHQGGGGGGGPPPPSPLLEAYHGTYQSISPMPFAIRPADDDSELDELSVLSPSISRSSNHPEIGKREKEKKRVKLYDPESDAKSIASALNHHKPEVDMIIDLLPGLTHDQVMGVRKEYKKQVRVQGKGVNLSKHVKTKLTGNFGKAVYVTTLGRWESEGYWANFWYQSHGSRRELLIESLMGRTNAEIRMIKDDFRDKRYSDSLSKCMEKELKMDKFRTAVLMVLEERRQEEQDVYPVEYIHRDCDTLFRAVKAEKGGESVMLDIVIRRSDAHLREVLRAYEKMYRENFARAALGKSNNLVGEVIAHILNGVINKPARDALLVQHALRDIAERNKDDALRYELLISRLVRIHWDKMHMVKVKKSFYDKHHIALEDAIENATKGEFREFMCELCDTK